MESLLDDLRALGALLLIDARIEKTRSMHAALDTGAQSAGAFTTQKTLAETLRADATKLAAVQRDSELKLESVEAKIAKENAAMYGGTIVNARELDNLRKEIEMLERQKTTAEEEVLVAMEATTTAAGLAAAAEAETKRLAKIYKATRAAYQKRHDELSAELSSLTQPRNDALAKVKNATLLAKYDAIRPKKLGLGAAFLDGETCGACHTRLNSNLCEAARAGKDIALCEYCGRILLPPQPSRPATKT